MTPRNANVLLSVMLLCTMFSGLAVADDASSNKREHKAKYVFYFIGDGMSISQVRIAESAMAEASFNANYKKQIAGTADAKVNDDTLNIRRLRATGMATTHAANRYITGSAAAATALATGYKTSINTISMNAERTKKLQTIAEAAKANGYKVGIITSVSIDHATPACFYAHSKDRSNYEEIGDCLINSDFDYFGGGTIKADSYKKSIAEYKKAAEAAGFKYVNTRADFDALNNKSGRVIASLKMLDNPIYQGAIPYTIDIDDVKEDNRIMLSEFTEKGIELLDNPNGFFMMIEGGKIDWTGHANDLVTNSYEVLSFDKAIGKALEFYKKHPDETLIVVTGDHETGGLSIGFAGTHYETSFGKLSKQDISYQNFSSIIVNDWVKKGNVKFADAMKVVEEHTGLGSKGFELSDYEMKRLKDAFKSSMTGKTSLSEEEVQLLYGTYDPFTVTITHILNNKAGIDWTSFSHTALPVPVFAIGCGENLFNGFFDNTDIPKKIAQSAGFKSFAE